MIKNDQIAALNENFKSFYSEDAHLVIRSPGRINLIGEHTDYNNGFVLPAAVNLSIHLAFAPSEKARKCHIISIDKNERYEFDLDSFSPLAGSAWQNYILGVVNELKKLGNLLNGFKLAFSGDLPQGAGMSSSAALECGVCYGLDQLFDLNLSREEMARISQRAEHDFVGVKCGIMDQFASLLGSKNQAMLLDCQTLNYSYLPIHLSEYKLLLLNSNVSHQHTSSGYNTRRAECEEGVSMLQKEDPSVKSLRDVDMEMLNGVKEKLREVVYRRCKYVIEENDRVLKMVDILKADRLEDAGNLLKKAQQAMREEYEITCDEIDFLADFANASSVVLGARMMGGGFGGCTINLIKREAESAFIKEITRLYQDQFGIELTPISIEISEGVHRL